MRCNFEPISDRLVCRNCNQPPIKHIYGDNAAAWPKRKCRITNSPNGKKGPGNFLHDAIQKRFGQKESFDCGCQSHLAQMNEWGPQGCREHLDEIVGWLLEEAGKRGMLGNPIKRFAAPIVARRMIKKAISQAEKASRVSPKP